MRKSRSACRSPHDSSLEIANHFYAIGHGGAHVCPVRKQWLLSFLFSPSVSLEAERPLTFSTRSFGCLRRESPCFVPHLCPIRPPIASHAAGPQFQPIARFPATRSSERPPAEQLTDQLPRQLLERTSRVYPARPESKLTITTPRRGSCQADESQRGRKRLRIRRQGREKGRRIIYEVSSSR